MGARPSSFTKPPVEPKVVRVWSEEQSDIFKWFAFPGGCRCKGTCECINNLVVTARAGAAKTTSIIEGVNRAPEDSILICAFNKRIAEDIMGKVDNPAVEVKTLHALGMHAIQREWRRIPVAERSARADSLTDAVVPKDTPRPIRRLISLLHTKGREMQPLDATKHSLLQLELFFDYCPEDGWGTWDADFVAQYALAAMEHAKANNPTYDIGIDFADMIFLPLTWDLLSKDYQMVVVDEAQDMTVSQLEIAKRVCCGRIVIVGDDRQAIYGFRGADTQSLSRLKKELHADHLTLKTTYRCGAAIVAEAQTLVADIQPYAKNAPGTVDACGYEDLLGAARGGDFVLSRINAPLVSLTLQFLQRGTRAVMAGRDIGAGISALLRKLKVNDYTPIETLLARLDEWERKTTTRMASYGQVALVERAKDQAAMIWALAEDAENGGQVLKQIDHLFSDEVPDSDIIRCSSVHKAKGLEANRVFILQESLYRRGRSPEEENIEYVAITRAKQHLTRVTGVPSLRSKR